MTMQVLPKLDGQVEAVELREAPLCSIVMVRAGKRIIPVRTSDILWISAAGNYIELHTEVATHVARMALGSVLELLDPNIFIRIHKSTAININAVAELQPWFSGQMRVVMVEKTVLTLSRKYRSEFASRIPFLL